MGVHLDEEKLSESGENIPSTTKPKFAFWKIVVLIICMVIVIILVFSYGTIEEDSVTEEISEINLNTNTTVIEIPKNGEYDCVENINCMPIIPEERNWVCSSDYINWATTNCTNFQIFR
jgi:hypothetical protein